MTDTENLREQFEAWARKNELEAERHKYADDQYDDHAATSAWWAWRSAFQAGNAATLADHFPGVRKMVGVELPESQKAAVAECAAGREIERLRDWATSPLSAPVAHKE